MYYGHINYLKNIFSNILKGLGVAGINLSVKHLVSVLQFTTPVMEYRNVVTVVMKLLN